MYFESIRVIIEFKDKKNIKHTIKADCIIRLDDESIYITARKIKKYMEKGKYFKIIKNAEIETFTENNIQYFHNFAKKFKIHPVLLMDFNFKLKNMSILKKRLKYSSMTEVYKMALFLNIKTPLGSMSVILKRRLSTARKQPQAINMIENHIRSKIGGE